MSDTSRPSAAVSPPARSVVHESLLQAALPLVRDWLPRRRWFAGKGRPIVSVTPVSATPLGFEPLLLHLLLRVEQQGGGSDCYQLLLGARPEGVPSADAVIGHVAHGPHDGLVLYDAAYDPALTDRLLRLLSTPQRRGLLRFSNFGELAFPVGTVGRVGTAEQSNTSIVYGDRAILKLFRRVSPGLNPDLELSLALARAGSTRIPAPLAWFESELPETPTEAPATLGLLQRFLSDGEDGWELALRRVGMLEKAPTEHVGNFAAESFLLGRATAEVHLALARSLPVTVLGRAEIESLADAMALRLDAAASAVPQLAPYQTGLRRIFRELAASARAGATLRVQRIHGDLHLGQVMRTARGWVLLDFEGEPAKPLSERRLPQPAIRDVAGMLRSFDYAAAHLGPSPSPEVATAASAWAARNRAAYCAGYAAAGAEDPLADPLLLRALETDKAVYEVLYEARHRPEWLPIPLSAISRLAT
ncbi:maltokinase N-terminal cap-like domain-containing protein, partial [Streptacidiphilus monticola]